MIGPLIVNIHIKYVIIKVLIFIKFGNSFQIQDRAKYDPKVPGWINVYTVLHFVLVVFAFDDLSRYNLVKYYFIPSKATILLFFMLG